VVVPVVTVAGLVIGVIAVVLGLVGWLGSRTYARATLGERRGGRIRTAATTPAVHPPTPGGTDA
jgi:hypothetical protein